jgi:hypothetical protein
MNLASYVLFKVKSQYGVNAPWEAKQFLLPAVGLRYRQEKYCQGGLMQ